MGELAGLACGEGFPAKLFTFEQFLSDLVGEWK
jgi:hypothetical protein